jgi:hypothetical protein
MARFLSCCFILITALTLALPRAAAESGNHTGENADLSTSIEFLAPALWTTTDALGTSFGLGAPRDPAFIYPSSLWGTYPGYYIGQTMHFRVTLSNTADHGNKTFKLTVSAASNAVELDGSDGVAIGAPQQWSVDSLAPGQTQVLDGSVSITGANIPVGLDVTRITIQHPNQGGDPTAGIIKVQTGVWCPPPSANN